LSRMKPVALRTADEIAVAIQDLSEADWTRLRKVAVIYTRNRLIEPDDLLQEAFRRALDGRRNCPSHVDAVRFLAEAMRSIADGEAEKAESQPRLVPIANHGTAETAVDPPDPALDPAQVAESSDEAAAMKASLLSLFEDDEIAQVILEGMMEGIEGEDLRELTELGTVAYQSKRRLIRRRIEKKFPQGWMS
jgi:DNA-directed RNA polymerase specialized sigma24 family protein